MVSRRTIQVVNSSSNYHVIIHRASGDGGRGHSPSLHLLPVFTPGTLLGVYDGTNQFQALFVLENNSWTDTYDRTSYAVLKLLVKTKFLF